MKSRNFNFVPPSSPLSRFLLLKPLNSSHKILDPLPLRPWRNYVWNELRRFQNYQVYFNFINPRYLNPFLHSVRFNPFKIDEEIVLIKTCVFFGMKCGQMSDKHKPMSHDGWTGRPRLAQFHQHVYVPLLCGQIPKVQKRQSSQAAFCAYRICMC